MVFMIQVHFSGICMVPNGITNRSKESRLEIYPIASSPATWKVASYIGKVFCPISNVICILLFVSYSRADTILNKSLPFTFLSAS